MPEPVSVISLFVGYAALNSLGLSRTAVSMEAQYLRDSACQVTTAREQSVSLFGEKSNAISKLLDMAAECSETGWDGDEAEPVSEVALERTRELIRAIPDQLPMPEFSAEPDGAVSVDWIESRTRLFSISVNDSQRLAYAWLDGADRGHGVAGFDGGTLPRKIFEGIHSLFGAADATLRAA